jgi:hypothetical protein
MYVDDKSGRAHKVGYIIAGLWLHVYAVTPAWN